MTAPTPEDRDALVQALRIHVPCTSHSIHYKLSDHRLVDAEGLADAVIAAGWKP